jgi:hypothetical protein
MNRNTTLDRQPELLTPSAVPDAPPTQPNLRSTWWNGLRDWGRRHRASLLILAGLLIVVGLVHWIGYDRFPGRLNDDEGTYVSQAWAVQYWHTLAHYTYWYDHPPVGWITIALYNFFTSAFERLPTAVTTGREVMFWAKVVSTAMVYLLARRLGFHRLAAAAAVLLFGLNPLALPLQRMVFLDNLAVMWTLAALAVAASPKRSLAASAGSALCFAIAVLSKETILVLLPAVFLLLWQHSEPRNRRYRVALFFALLGGITALYPLYALLKGELLEGPGHVSLAWAVKWQLFERIPTGSLLDTSSRTHIMVRSWLEQEPWLLGAAVLLIPLSLAFRNLRAVGLALAIQVLILCRNGFLPYAYPTSLVPFAALVVPGVADRLCKGLPERRPGHSRRLGIRGTWLPALIKRTGQLVVAIAVVAGLVAVTPAWAHGLRRAMTEDHSQPPKQALTYVLNYVPPRAILLVDDNLWTDLVRNGFTPTPIWFYKLELDPAVREKYRNGWRDVDYIVTGYVPDGVLEELPLVTEAFEHSQVVARFGSGETEVTVRKIVKDASD